MATHANKVYCMPVCLHTYLLSLSPCSQIVVHTTTVEAAVVMLRVKLLGRMGWNCSHSSGHRRHRSLNHGRWRRRWWQRICFRHLRSQGSLGEGFSYPFAYFNLPMHPSASDSFNILELVLPRSLIDISLFPF